jgi:serine/threonine protein kinase
MNTHEVPRSRNAWTGIQRAASSLARLLPSRGREPSAEAGLRQVATPLAGHHACSAAASCSASAANAAASARDAPGGAAEGAGITFGYAGGLEHRYELGRELGRGGNAVVRIVRDRRTGLELACKTIKKVCAPRQHAAFPPDAPRRVCLLSSLLGNLGKHRHCYTSSGPTLAAARVEQKLRAQSAAPARAALTPPLAPSRNHETHSLAGARRPVHCKAGIACKGCARAPRPAAWQVLDDPALSEQKRRNHLAAVRSEVDAMRKLRGTLNAACFEEAFEDAEHVHIVMEWCRGGELHHRIGDKHYSERTVRHRGAPAASAGCQGRERRARSVPYCSPPANLIAC